MDSIGNPAVLLEERAGAAWVVLNRPERRNALDTAAWEELGRALGEIQDRGDVRAVVITGNGPSFSTGLDLTELRSFSVDRAERVLRVVEETFERIENLPCPTIAAIHGWTLGSGAELAMACDLRIAASNLRFGLPIARLGIMISSRLLQRFVNVLGMGATKELAFTGRYMAAAEAMQCGLVNRVVPPDNVREAVLGILDEMALSSPAAIRAAKRSLALCQPITMAERLPPVAPYFLDPADFQEGVDAFLSGRPPRFRGSPAMPSPGKEDPDD